MDTNPVAAPEMQSPFPQNPNPRSGNIGALTAAVVIVLILAAGGFYFFHTQQERQAQGGAQAQQASAPAAQDGSDSSVDSIEADLNATATNETDQDVDNLDSAL